ncbi:MAG: hypothetical protein F6K22_03625 [Okeania sp. SIO2F4]|uniref:hypothetical protein n=1 Tax=Okeania sp. SIO2F4 TaxID=2607790 RepID=UPI00142B33C7|nr:hypothetical protein [Okeania sp. SIO2F4]NES01996.1 hypothetical protein [Okeania sp. SIO2F4]
MPAATQSINYFIGKKPSPEDQKILDKLDEILPKLNQQEILEAIHDVSYAMADLKDKSEYKLFEELGADIEEDSSNVAILKALATYLSK